MNDKHPRNPLYGITLEMILTQLVVEYGWTELGRMIDIRCFNHEPSIKSSLKFLRKTPWARTRVEELYINKRRIQLINATPSKLSALRIAMSQNTSHGVL